MSNKKSNKKSNRKTKYNKSKKLEKLRRLLLQKKKSKLKFARLFVILNITFLTLFIIACNSNYLFNSVFKWIFFILFVASFGLFLYYIIGYVSIDRDLKLPIKRWILNGITIIYVIGCLTFIFLLYGPYPKFREWLITTAMETMNHKYLCKIFYSDTYINNLLSQNYLVEPDEEFDSDLIVQDKKIQEFDYDENNEYEVKMFKDHTEDEIYRLIRFKVNDQNAYLAIVYDPAYCEFLASKNVMVSGEYIVDMAKRTHALIAVNGGRFIDPTNKSNGNNPAGVTIQKGKIITDYDYAGNWGVIGFNKDNILVLYKNKNAKELIELGVRDAVTSVPFLIVNGVPAFTKGNGGYGYAARTAVGQRKDGVTLILVVDSNETRTNGASMKDLTDIMLHYGAINAAALDGGTSTVMVENGITISRPVNGSLKKVTRPVATGLIVNPEKIN